ncbi:MAG: ABC transporter permease [Methanophagales archaeon]|nr:ABC transporter permease [Methanophagales archaeon]
MSEIVEAFITAVYLIITLDPEVAEIAIRSVTISALATFFASLICIPVGGLIYFHNFRGKRAVISAIQTLFSLPTVVVGLFVFLMLSRVGPLGIFGLLFTPWGMVIGQTVLISPIILGFTISALSGVGKEIRDTTISLGATRIQAIIVIIKEVKFAIMSTVLLGFGRAISEVGIAMMIGGNIKGFTRVLTSAIALETAKGDIVLGIALGIILMMLALVATILVNIFMRRMEPEFV